jgi:hypothetical protein
MIRVFLLAFLYFSCHQICALYKLFRKMAVHNQIINMYAKMMFLLVVLVAIATTVSGDNK